MCGNFVSTLIRFPILVYKLFNWLLDASGNPSKAFVNAAQPTGSLLFSSFKFANDSTKLFCDGTEVSKEDFPDLYAIIQDTYGTPSSSAVFKLPDYRGKFLVGIGNLPNQGSVTAGTPGGTDQQSLAVANLPKHSHFTVAAVQGSGDHLSDPTKAVAITNLSGGGGGSTDYWLQTAQSSTPATTGKSSDVGNDTPTPLPTVPPYLGLYVFIIA